MSEVPAGNILLRWLRFAMSGLQLSGCAGTEGRLLAEGQPHLGNDVRFASVIQGCQMQPRSLIICQDGVAGCAP